MHDGLLRGDRSISTTASVVKGSGDGVLPRSTPTTDALAAAIAVQQRFDAYSRARRAVDADRVRVGLSVGDVVHRTATSSARRSSRRCASRARPTRPDPLLGAGARARSRSRRLRVRARRAARAQGTARAPRRVRVRWAPADRAGPPLPLPPSSRRRRHRSSSGATTELAIASNCAAAVEQAHMRCGCWASRASARPGWPPRSPPARTPPRARALRPVRRARARAVPARHPGAALVRRGSKVDDELRDALGVDPGAARAARSRAGAAAPGLGRRRARPRDRAVPPVRVGALVARDDLGATRPVVFVVDDVHWADRPTLALLGHVLRSAQPTRLTSSAPARDTRSRHQRSVDRPHRRSRAHGPQPAAAARRPDVEAIASLLGGARSGDGARSPRIASRGDGG